MPMNSWPISPIRAVCALLLAVSVACAQSVSSGSFQENGSFQMVSMASPGGFPVLPEVWVDNNEATDGFTYAPAQYEIQLGPSGGTWITGPPTGCSFTLSNYVDTAPGLQAAVNDLEACRTLEGGATGFYLDVPPAVYAFGQYGFTIPQTASVAASSFIIVRSTQDSMLPIGQPVCAHGIQDNLPSSTAIGLNNPDCTGQNMYYALGPQTTATAATTGVSASMSGTIATFTLVSGTFPFSPGQIVHGGNKFSYNGYQATWQILTVAGGTMTATSCMEGPSLCQQNLPPDNNTVINTISVDTNNEGSGYHAGDTLSVIQAGGSGGTVNVSTVDSNGAITKIKLVNGGSGYSVANGVTLSGGNGNGAEADITAVGGIGTLTPEGTITGIITLSAHTTTLLAVPSSLLNVPIQIPLANGYVSPANSYVVDSGGNQETVIAQAGPNQTGLYAVFTKPHAAGVPVTYDVGDFTLADGTVTSTSAYNDLQYMWQVSGSGANPNGLSFCEPSTYSPPPPSALTCGNSAGLAPDHWMFEDLAASPAAGQSGSISAIKLGDEGDSTATSQMPVHVHFRKIWAHGDWTNIYTATNSIADAIKLDCFFCSVVDFQTSQSLRPGGEGHGLGMGYTSQAKIVDGWMEGASIGSICGGISGDASIQGIILCQDVQFGRLRSTFPWAWMGVDNGYSDNPNYPNAFAKYRKNAMEFKQGNRIVIYGSYLENVDNSGAQNGVNVLKRVTNSSSGFGSNYWFKTLNILDYNNIHRNSCSGPGSQGRSDAITDGNGATLGMANVTYWNDLAYNISQATIGDCFNATARGWGISTGNVQWNGTITEDPTGTFATLHFAGCGELPGWTVARGVGRAGCKPGRSDSDHRLHHELWWGDVQ